MFIFVFLPKFVLAHTENFLTKITKIFTKTLTKFSQKYEKIGLFKKLESSLTSGLWKRIFFFPMFINSSIFDQPCKDRPGQPGQDGTVTTGKSVQDFEDRAPSTGHAGQDR
jgi:hypothetical protein